MTQKNVSFKKIKTKTFFSFHHNIQTILASTALMTFTHYIFGYRSLICPASRTITAPTIANRVATPVRVKNLERSWSVPLKDSRMTVVGVTRKVGAECVGVLIPVNEVELEQFDERERGYDRLPVHENDIRRIHYSNPSITAANTAADAATTMMNPHCFFNDNSNKTSIWVYVQQHPIPVTLECPVAQSYVDIILRGCLTISKEFAKEFIISTKGWHPSTDPPLPPSTSSSSASTIIISNKNDHENNRRIGYWVNDRETPLYCRADSHYSKMNGHQLDTLLQLYRPEEMKYRCR